ncbi:hypothetical protein [Aminicella lysinilytica]|uniref:Uncharacterized protein n=1 Tax=Aminicella lysinilytica TaxID=433323 RepID=A0A4R6QC27_9FIRM|nr:hypothetical protein [Aminicella lysinilytica]TDP59855.1 hypothetical protein EV211_10297 [Aminicella lysinilytica]
MIQNMINTGGGSNADGSILFNNFDSEGYPSDVIADFGDNDIKKDIILSSDDYNCMYSKLKNFTIKCGTLNPKNYLQIYPRNYTIIKLKIFAKSISSRKIYFTDNTGYTKLWISKDTETLPDTIVTTGTICEIYTDALSKPSGWSSDFNYNGSSLLTVNYGVSESAFDAI